MGKHKLSSISLGLAILEKFCSDNVLIGEAGSCLCVWESDDVDIILPPEWEKALKSLGWFYDEGCGWMIRLES